MAAILSRPQCVNRSIHVAYTSFFTVRPEHTQVLNSSYPEWNGRHFTDIIFKSIFMNEKFCILIQISLKFGSKGLIDNKSVLVPVVAWRWTGDKLLSERVLTQFTDIYAAQGGGELNQILKCFCLTHCGLVTPYGNIDQGQYCFR